MNNSIQANYGEMVYNMSVKNRGSKQAGMTAGSFLDMVSQAGTKWSETQSAT